MGPIEPTKVSTAASKAACPACGAPLRPSRQVEWVRVCDSCGLSVSDLVPGPGTGVEGLEALRRGNFELLLRRVNGLQPLKGSRLLEIGCAKGWFLEMARDRGALVRGVEPEDANAALAREKGLIVDTGLFPNFPTDKGPYDLVVFNDVFEHLPDPRAAMIAAADLLSPDGLLVINLPNGNGFLYRVALILLAIGIKGPFERLWQKGMPSPHVTYFTPSSLRSLAAQAAGLEEIGRMRLPTVTRQGLAARVASQPSGVPTIVAVPMLWGLSYLLPVLPADIHVGMFRKPQPPVAAS